MQCSLTYILSFSFFMKWDRWQLLRSPQHPRLYDHLSWGAPSYHSLSCLIKKKKKMLLRTHESKCIVRIHECLYGISKGTSVNCKKQVLIGLMFTKCCLHALVARTGINGFLWRFSSSKCIIYIVLCTWITECFLGPDTALTSVCPCALDLFSCIDWHPFFFSPRCLVLSSLQLCICIRYGSFEVHFLR